MPGPVLRSVFTNVGCATGVHTARIEGEQMNSCAQVVWKIIRLWTVCPDVSLCGDRRLLTDTDIEGEGKRKGISMGQRHAPLVLPSSGRGAVKFQEFENFKLELGFSDHNNMPL